MSGFEQCPKCKKDTMPIIKPGSRATAVQCQNPKCMFVFERPTELVKK